MRRLAYLAVALALLLGGCITNNLFSLAVRRAGRPVSLQARTFLTGGEGDFFPNGTPARPAKEIQ